MRAELSAYFGNVPADAENLEIVGAYERRFEERPWATVWPNSGVIRWEDGTIETETIWQDAHLSQCGDYFSRWSLFPRRYRGIYFNLGLFWGRGYYHWICDVLTRLHLVLPKLTPEIRVIVPAALTTWQKRSLELIGLPAERCVAHSGKRPWRVERLFYASPVSMTGDHEEESLHWVRDTILHSCLGDQRPESGWRKLYLTRRQTWSRNVANESELIPLLVERGFEVMDCATMTFDEQVRLFSEASCVVGPHGAAITNILWSPPGAKVFEIFEPKAVRRCYWSMCRSLNHFHGCGIGESVLTNTGREPDILVDKDAFANALDRMFGDN